MVVSDDGHWAHPIKIDEASLHPILLSEWNEFCGSNKHIRLLGTLAEFIMEFQEGSKITEEDVEKEKSIVYGPGLNQIFQTVDSARANLASLASSARISPPQFDMGTIQAVNNLGDLLKGYENILGDYTANIANVVGTLDPIMLSKEESKETKK